MTVTLYRPETGLWLALDDEMRRRGDDTPAWLCGMWCRELHAITNEVVAAEADGYVIDLPEVLAPHVRACIDGLREVA